MVNAYNPKYTFTGNKLSFLLKEAFDETIAGKSKLPDWIIQMPGMSGVLYRNLINNLVEKIDNARYLEVGSWKGSTSCSAMYKNKVDVCCIDNWELFNPHGDVKSELFSNLSRTTEESNNSCNFTVLESNFQDVDYATLKKHNVFMFDGPHEEVNQLLGIILAQPALESEYVLIVDDWNWKKVRVGTMNALDCIYSNVLFSIEIRTSEDESHPDPRGGDSYWHNGVFIGVIQKKI